MTIEISIEEGNKYLVVGKFQNIDDANEFLWTLLKEHGIRDIWIKNTENGNIIRCDKLFGEIIS